jgi:uncharacterized protein (DUF433 family)
MNHFQSEWQEKGATLSMKTACKEYGLTEEQLETAIRAGKLQYRHQAMHGNPFVRLLRSEVEALVMEHSGEAVLATWKDRTALARINQELKKLRSQIADLEERKAKLLAGSGK